MTSGDNAPLPAAPAAGAAGPPGGPSPDFPNGAAAPFGEGADPAPGMQPQDGAGDPERSFAEDLRDLAGDTKTLLEAAKAYEGARLSYALSRGKGVVVSFAMAGAFVYFALVALVVGLLLALTPLLTAWGALAVVFLGLMLLAFVFLRSGLNRVKRMRLMLGGAAAGLDDEGETR